MIGIKCYATYVPLWRLELGSIQGGLRGEKAVANFDEDSLTMGVAAGRHCLQHVDRNAIDGLFFASTTFPYREKQTSVTAATALDLRDDVMTVDFANSLRAGTTALKAAVDMVKAGAAKQILVIAADMRLSQPGSDFEREFGDGAAALIISSDEAKVTIKDSYFVADEIFDVWRTDEDRYVRSWEERFNLDEGYFRVLPKAVTGLMEKNNLSSQDFAKAVFYGPNSRRHREMGRRLSFAEEQVQAPLFGSIGDTGTAASLMMLAASLEQAKPGDKILLASYGNGADALLLEVVKETGVNPTLSEYIDSKRVLPDYKRYLVWRGLLDMVTGRRRPPAPTLSATCIWRETEQNIRLHGVKCKHCGMVQYPPTSVCFHCHTKDEFETYSFSDKRARLTTYTADYATPTPDSPLVLAVIDFEDGGRMWAYMTDKDEKEVQIGMPVAMTFRKLFTADGIHNYFWKCMPIRFPKEEVK